MASEVPRDLSGGREHRTFLDDLARRLKTLETGGVVAPVNASYVLISNDATLSNDRALAVAAPLSLTDGGAGGAATLGLAAGAVLQCLQTTYATNADLTTVIPFDDTTPTSSEGTQVLSQAITPASASNKVLVRAIINGAVSNANRAMIAALFRGTTCLDAKVHYFSAANLPAALAMEYLDSPAAASAQTYSIRVGADANTLRLNGSTVTRFFGGTAVCTLTLLEIKG